MEVVLPGDNVAGLPQAGPGLYLDSDTVRVHTVGILRRAEKRTWVNYSCKRVRMAALCETAVWPPFGCGLQYVPSLNERVLGVVAKSGKQSKVDIGAAVGAYLPELEFEGATKRNKPNLEVRVCTRNLPLTRGTSLDWRRCICEAYKSAQTCRTGTIVHC